MADTGILKESGEPQLIWKRHPREGSRTIALEPGRIEPWNPVPDCPDVHVQGLVRKRDAHWSISLFLVNGQEEPKRKRDETWLFQPEIIAESADGNPVFHRRPVRRSGRGASPGDPAPDPPRTPRRKRWPSSTAGTSSSRWGTA